MASGSSGGFVKTALIPLLVAGGLYLLLYYGVYPFYRRYRADIARYSQYAPLSSTLQSTTSIFGEYIPNALRPRSIRERLGELFVRLVVPSRWAARNRGRWGGDDHDELHGPDSGEGDDDGGLFDEESGERMVGFDMNEGRRGVDGRRRGDGRLGIRHSGEDAAIENAVDARGFTRSDTDDSNRRLSRDLEEGFMDDSDSESSEDEVHFGRSRQ